MPPDWKQSLPKPVAGYIPAQAPRPKTGNIPPKKKWKFSFRYWKQIEYFGVDQCDKSWFVSLLERLTEVSSLEVEDALAGSYGTSLRCHPINWDARNIPISRAEIDWLGEYSSDDFELIQFSISTGRGRIIGFFDADHIFHIVLLDPLHNLQPAKKRNYQVRASYIAQCAITRMSVTFERLILNCPQLSEPQQSDMLKALKAQNLQYFDAAVHLSISDAHLEKAYGFARSGVIEDLGELLQLTIDELN
jgi:hypothetical protein